jgi:hypothetical protein
VSGQPGRIRGRLCQLTDLRGDAPCTPLTGVALRITVRETGDSDTTGADGTFDLPGQTNINPVTLITPANDALWHGTAFPVFLDEGGTATLFLPLMRRVDLEELATANLLTLDTARAVVSVQVRRNLAGTSGFTAGTIDGVEALYETGDPLVWTATAPTGVRGSVLWLNVGPGSRTFDLTGPTGPPATYVLPTIAGTLTIAPIDL